MTKTEEQFVRKTQAINLFLCALRAKPKNLVRAAHRASSILREICHNKPTKRKHRSKGTYQKTYRLYGQPIANCNLIYTPWIE